MRTPRLVPAVLSVVLALFTAAACSGPSHARATAVSARSSVPVTKLLVFIEENHSLDQMKAGMPYAASLATRYGYATNHRAITHPSLGNYVAIAGGSSYGISDDDPPSAHRLTGRSVFGQALLRGKTAATYSQSIPTACNLSNSGGYAVKHNPWAYFVNERAGCRAHDKGMAAFNYAAATGHLPNVGMVVPNLDSDAHDGSLAAADGWFKQQMTKVFAGPDWKSGRLAVVLTADEDDHNQNNTVLTVVIHRSQHHHVVTTGLTHYSLTRLYEEVAGLPYLRNARTAPSMAKAFGLPLR